MPPPHKAVATNQSQWRVSILHEIYAQLHNAPLEHCYACLSTRGCALDSVWKMSADADPNPPLSSRKRYLNEVVLRDQKVWAGLARFRSGSG